LIPILLVIEIELINPKLNTIENIAKVFIKYEYSPFKLGPTKRVNKTDEIKEIKKLMDLDTKVFM
jgi:hypothetical protein